METSLGLTFAEDISLKKVDKTLLIKEVEKGVELKHATTEDKSAPVIPGKDLSWRTE